jgi:hypothetical protein
MPTIEGAFYIIGKTICDFGKPSFSDLHITVWLIVIVGIAVLFFKDLRDEYAEKKWQFLENKIIRWGIYVFLFCMILLFGVLDSNNFIYVNF